MTMNSLARHLQFGDAFDEIDYDLG